MRRLRARGTTVIPSRTTSFKGVPRSSRERLTLSPPLSLRISQLGLSSQLDEVAPSQGRGVAASSRPVSADRSLSPVICLPDGRPTPAFGRSLRPARQQRIPIAVASLLYLIAGTCTTACPWEGEGDRYVVVTSPDLSAIARSRAVRVHGLGKTAPAEAPTNQRVLLALSLHCPERLSRRRLLMAEPFEPKCVLRATNHDKRPLSVDFSLEYPARSGVQFFVDGQFLDHSDAFSCGGGEPTLLTPGTTAVEEMPLSRIPTYGGRTVSRSFTPQITFVTRVVITLGRSLERLTNRTLSGLKSSHEGHRGQRLSLPRLSRNGGGALSA
jgi:hypothetical protein